MSSVSIHSLPYQADPVALFEQLRELPWAQLLDSSGCGGERGRYDILVADPYIKITTSENVTIVQDRDNDILETAHHPFEIIRQQLCPCHVVADDLPFTGGAVGYFGYDLEIEPDIVSDRRPALFDIPDMALGVYDWGIVTDHQRQETRFVAAGNDITSSNETLHWLEDKLASSEPATSTAEPLSILLLETDTELDDYRERFTQIQRYLRDGDCYQVNYARCFTSSANGSPWESYKRLRQANPVPFGAYLELPFAQVLSASPERFLHVAGQQVETRPIKGTRPRGADQAADDKLVEALAASDKDRAENLMIVDLLRNDLGKTCVPGTIKVPELFSVEPYPTVLHLVSSITGTIAEDNTAIDVLEHCFPGGSVTGAPKKRAMEIIRELEQRKRGIYCGAIGYISFNGNMDTNIAIRTMTVSHDKLAFWAGGGIVADSVMEEEFQETLDKARAFMDLLRKPQLERT